MNLWKVAGLLIVVVLGLGAVPFGASQLEADSRPEVAAGTTSCPAGTRMVTVLAGDFEGAWPGDWAVFGGSSSSSCGWERGESGNQTGGTGRYAEAGGSGCLGEAVNTGLESPLFDLSGSRHAWLEFKSDYYLPETVWGPVAGVWLHYGESNDIQLFCTTERQPGPQTVAVDIPMEHYQAGSHLEFGHAHEATLFSLDAWWQVDEVRVVTCRLATYLPFVERNVP